MNLGDAFTMAVPPKYDCPHLYFVISDPALNGNVFLIVNITTDVFRAGRECVLDRADHEWIREPSFVSFTDAMEIDSQKRKMIESLVGKTITPQTSLKAPVLAKIVKAAKESKSIEVASKRLL